MRVLQTTTDDRRQRPLLVWPATLRVGRPVIIIIIITVIIVVVVAAVVVLVNKSQFKSIDFAINSAFSRIFRVSYPKSQDIIDNCRTVFNCQPLADRLSTRKINFLSKYINSRNIICRIFCH